MDAEPPACLGHPGHTWSSGETATTLAWFSSSPDLQELRRSCLLAVGNDQSCAEELVHRTLENVRHDIDRYLADRRAGEPTRACFLRWVSTIAAETIKTCFRQPGHTWSRTDVVATFEWFATSQQCQALWKYCYGKVGSGDDADELVQKIMTDAVAKIHSYDPHRSGNWRYPEEGFVRWLFGIAHHNWPRRGEGVIFTSRLPEVATRDTQPLLGEYWGLVEPVLSRLSEQCRGVLQLAFIESLDHREIADRLGISVNNSRIQRLRACRKFRKALLTRLEQECRGRVPRDLLLGLSPYHLKPLLVLCQQVERCDVCEWRREMSLRDNETSSSEDAGDDS